jgi:YidC/Oxa1 family membrane protein insertase
VPEHQVATCVMTDDAATKTIEDTISTSVGELPAEGSVTYTFGIYIGPKTLEGLQAFSAVNAGGVDLSEAIDWGYLGSLGDYLGELLLRLMRFFYGIVGSWGVAIVLLTITVKLATLPLTLKQMRSMKRMKEIQPEMQKIKEKYAEDRVKQGQEMQALFARSGVNPLAGCLPILAQMPIWIALYWMLGAAVELVHVPFLWLPDLTKQDPFYILPLSWGAMMFLQNRMMPSMGDEAQARMMKWIMPVMFTGLMLFLPSGLGVYMFANTVLSIVQTAIQVGTGAKQTEAAANTRGKDA